jgi:two-component system chemotaxis response regulator CheY
MLLFNDMSSRVIKFRVWDTEYKEFSNWTNRDPFFDVSNGQLFFWERVQKERQERIKRLEEESYRKTRGAELAQKDEEQNAEFKKAALKHLAEGGKAEVITALKAGVNNYIVKPFNAEVLKEELDGVLKK